jgi:hypothetical protein
MADGGSGDANTADPCSTKAATEGNICYRGGLIQRRGRHSLRRGSEQQGKTSNSYQPNHL